MRKSKKGAIWWDKIAVWILIFLVLALVVTGILLLTGKGSGALNFIKDLFRFKG